MNRQTFPQSPREREKSHHIISSSSTDLPRHLEGSLKAGLVIVRHTSAFQNKSRHESVTLNERVKCGVPWEPSDS